MTARRIPTAFLALVALVSATAALTFVAPGAARAHSELVSSSPEDGEEVYERPDAIVLEFNENIQEIGTEIVVSAPDGTDITDGDPQIDGMIVTQPLAADTATLPVFGDHTVTWRVVSSDGHPISGELTFEVLTNTWDDVIEETTEPDTETTDDAATGAEDTSSPSPASDTEDDSGSDLAVPVVIGLAVLVLAGVAVLVIRRRRAR